METYKEKMQLNFKEKQYNINKHTLKNHDTDKLKGIHFQMFVIVHWE